MECFCFLRNIQDLLSDGKTPYGRRFGESSKGPITPFESLIECHPVSPKYQTRVHQFGKKILPGVFLGYALIAGGIWKGDVLVADMEALEKFDASDVHPRRINAKEILIRQTDDEFIFPFADGTANLSGIDYEFRKFSLRREPTRKEPRFQWRTRESLNRQKPQMTVTPVPIFWSIQGDFICRHHNEIRVQTVRAEGKNISYSTEIY